MANLVAFPPQYTYHSLHVSNSTLVTSGESGSTPEIPYYLVPDKQAINNQLPFRALCFLWNTKSWLITCLE